MNRFDVVTFDGHLCAFRGSALDHFQAQSALISTHDRQSIRDRLLLRKDLYRVNEWFVQHAFPDLSDEWCVLSRNRTVAKKFQALW